MANTHSGRNRTEQNGSAAKKELALQGPAETFAECVVAIS